MSTVNLGPGIIQCSYMYTVWNSKAEKILKLKLTHSLIVKFIANAWASSNAWAISTSPCMVKMSHKCMVNSKY